MNVIGFLGSQKDSRGKDERRWERFRPSVALCMHESLPVKKYYLLYQPANKQMLEYVIQDILTVSPDTNVVPVEMAIDDAFEPMEAFEKQLAFVNSLDFNEEYYISLTTGTHVNQYVWFKLVENNFINAKLIQIHGYPNEKSNPKGLTPHQIAQGKYRVIDLNLAKYDRFHELTAQQQAQVDSYLKRGIVTKNTAYNEVIEMMEKVAVRNNHPVLVTGPTGAGKTQLVRRLFELKKQKGMVSGQFRTINCATLQSDSAMSVLFGHKKGAYTGATTDREGLLKQADGGVLFLDEIGELSLEIQGMLLTAIETKSFRPMGSDKEEYSDFVLLSGTNKDLYQAVDNGQFRDDLFARINLWHFELPGIKDRQEDIEANVDFELLQIEKSQSFKVRFNREARKAYLSFAVSPAATWQRNFRDLTSSITRMATLADHGIIDEDNVASEIARLKKSWDQNVNQNASSGIALSAFIGELASQLSAIDAMVLKETIGACMRSETASEAAKKLYNSEDGQVLSKNPQGRLSNYLAKYGLSFKSINAMTSE